MYRSVEKRAGREIRIEGNAFSTGEDSSLGWNEPGTVWVMQDEDGDGQPNNTWYELKGSHTLLPQTKRRYAVTYTSYIGSTGNSMGAWKDNYGGIGDYYNYPTGSPSPMTFVGTGLPGGWSQYWSGYVDAICPPLFSIGDAIQTDGSPVNLAYIDFVKVQTGLNMDTGLFGEISTEIDRGPVDTNAPDPAMLLTGADAGGGQHSYRFINNSGYDLTVTFADTEFTLARGTEETKTIPSSQAYFDYYGGNVNFVRETGTVTFANRPD
jgi:hypothetical protein